MGIIGWLEKTFAAAAFAEEGEFDTARSLAEGDGNGKSAGEGAPCQGDECLAPPLSA